MEEANGLVRWPEEAPALGQREDDLQGLPLVELPRKNSGAAAEPQAEAHQEGPAEARAFAEEGANRPAVLPRCGE